MFAEKDRGVKVADVRRFEKALQNLRKDYEIHIYPDANHNFANPSARNYSAGSAENAWQRTIEFLHQNLIVETGESS